MNSIASKKGIDTHFHVFHAGIATECARYVPQYTAALEDWMSAAHRVGVTRGVWVQPSFLGVDNTLMLHALDAYPHALRGVAVVAPDTPSGTLAAMHASGVRGIRLNLAGISHAIPQWTRADLVWQTLHDLGWHVEVHTDQGALPQVLAQLPADLTLVIDHMGKPSEANLRDATVQALVHRAQHVPTYIKLSGAYRLGGLEATRLAHLWQQEMGVHALLWGSDWPCTNHEHLANYADLYGALETWVGTPHLDQVLRDNPERLYGF